MWIGILIIFFCAPFKWHSISKDFSDCFTISSNGVCHFWRGQWCYHLKTRHQSMTVLLYQLTNLRRTAKLEEVKIEFLFKFGSQFLLLSPKTHLRAWRFCETLFVSLFVFSTLRGFDFIKKNLLLVNIFRLVIQRFVVFIGISQNNFLFCLRATRLRTATQEFGTIAFINRRLNHWLKKGTRVNSDKTECVKAIEMKRLEEQSQEQFLRFYLTVNCKMQELLNRQRQNLFTFPKFSSDSC